MKKLSDDTAASTRQFSSPCFCANLRRASRAVTRVYEEEFRNTGFTGVTQYHVLGVVERSGAVRQRDLGTLLDLDETTVARTLKPLFEKGWLEQEAGKDRREKWITLTAGGRQQLERARPAWERAQARIKRALPRNMWDSLMESMPKIAELSESA
jgi:DNA-binding MarR family transcriptional regulator